MTVRTRFAPSPTGYLHIGGVRTALFNWLFARKHGGQFILRIDDTDQERNVAAALAPILAGFKWLGIDWDEGAEVGGPNGPYYQSQRLPRYQEAVRQLVEKGFAYHDYANKGDLEAELKAAQAEKRSYQYDRKWMAATPEDHERFKAQGRKASVRLKMPRAGKCEFTDLIRGPVSFDWSREADVVIQRDDGSCLYNLANVVDDFDMKISHVIRAEEHLSNTPRQIFIGQGLGYPLPAYAHLPYVAAPGGKEKLSKRSLDKYLKNPEFKKAFDHGKSIADRIGLTIAAETFNPVIVDFYRQVGYLPDAIINYLLLLGWSLDDKTEWFTRPEMIDAFSLERVVKSPASFDSKKLLAFQDHYMQAVPAEQKAALALPYLQAAKLPAQMATLTEIVQAAGDRIKTAGDILDFADFFTPDDALPYDDKAFDKRIRNAADAPALLRAFREKLAAAEAFDAKSLETLLHDFLKEKGVEIGQIIHALRVALTGKAVGFGVFETLAILGKPSCLARIDRALGRL